jgi:L-alanine-DL-glutamate epimerase-like enolase superfamily enzyme
MITATLDIFPLARTFTISRGSKTEARVISATVTRGGITGRGECVPYARYGETPESVLAQIAALPEVITRDALQDALPPGAARNAVDCALWDWQAKAAGARIWSLLGLPTPTPRVPSPVNTRSRHTQAHTHWQRHTRTHARTHAHAPMHTHPCSQGYEKQELTDWDTVRDMTR